MSNAPKDDQTAPQSSSEPAMPSIHGFQLGPHQTNCYVATAPSGDGTACWIIDAGYQPEELIDWVRSQGLTPEALILTHAHCDHMAGVDAVRAAFPGVPVFLHDAEAEWLANPELNLSAAMGIPATAAPAEYALEEGQTLTLGDTRWRVLHTPGHSPGSVSIVCESAAVAFVGDALFAGSVGRTDFPTSDHEALMAAISEKLYALPDETQTLSGHGPPTTIGHEKRTNPFVRG